MSQNSHSKSRLSNDTRTEMIDEACCKLDAAVADINTVGISLDEDGFESASHEFALLQDKIIAIRARLYRLPR
jgi:hypothetical protein